MVVLDDGAEVDRLHFENQHRQLVAYVPPEPRVVSYIEPPWYDKCHYELYSAWDSFYAGQSWKYEGWQTWYRQIAHVSLQLTRGFEAARQCDDGVLVEKGALHVLTKVRRKWTRYWLEFGHPDEGILFHWMQRPGNDGIIERSCLAVHLYVEWARLNVLCALESCYDATASPDWSLCKLTTLTPDQTLEKWGALRRCNAADDFKLLCRQKWTMYAHPILCYSQREILHALNRLKLEWKHLMINVTDSLHIYTLVRELKRYLDMIELRACMFFCETFPARVLDDDTMSVCVNERADQWRPNSRFCFLVANDFFWFKRSLFYYHHMLARQPNKCAQQITSHPQWHWSAERFQVALRQWYAFQDHCFSDEQQKLESTDNPFLSSEALIYEYFGLCYGDEQRFIYNHPHESNNTQNMVEKIYSKKKWRWIRTVFDNDVQPLVHMNERQCDDWQKATLKIFLVLSSMYEELRIVTGNKLSWIKRYVVLHGEIERKRFMLERSDEPLVVECIPGFFTILHQNVYYEAPNIDALMVIYCHLVHTCHQGKLLDGNVDVSRFLDKIVVLATPAADDGVTPMDVTAATMMDDTCQHVDVINF
jgi:hypothetical protein